VVLQKVVSAVLVILHLDADHGGTAEKQGLGFLLMRKVMQEADGDWRLRVEGVFLLLLHFVWLQLVRLEVVGVRGRPEDLGVTGCHIIICWHFVGRI